MVEAVSQDLQTRDEALKQLRYHLARAQDQMTQYANKKRVEAKIKEGDWVFLKIRPHRQTSMPTRLHPKLSTRYYGPFLVEKQIGYVAFRLQLSETSRVHHVFHVFQLKLAIREHRVKGALPTELQDDRPMYTPLKVLQRRN
ncbi:uncharacterized protein LOC124845982 [Vigna umbellata]|uniref:uncharacterized protein LOC124845982 n=1 Tax=Vigna umbellata TaxID=87088 RepID=UPI001F5EB3B3|nr:uncharacterized protein LOC124845982 [Vigna umbellata]